MYGAGNAKLGRILVPDRGYSVEKLRRIGGKYADRFLEGLPALKRLQADVKKSAREKGWLRMPDGRITYTRSERAALNTLLQSAGSVVSKQWICLTNMALQEKYGVQGWDGAWAGLGWFHDEIQIAACTQEIAEDIGKIAVAKIREAGEVFNWRCPLDGEYKVGRNRAECH